MSILDKLKSFINFDFSGLKNFKVLNISVNIDRSVHINNAKGILTLNPDKLDGRQKQALSELLSTDGLEESGVILHSRDIATVNNVRECLPIIEPEVQLFLPVIPREDVPLLRACLYLRNKFQQKENIDNLKAQIVRVYGVRGRNFANLCSADYLETWFKPLLDQLKLEHPDDMAAVKEKFQQDYNIILANIPWTVFVSSWRHDGVAAQIIKKMQGNLKNGIYHLNVHGLGEANVKRIEAALPDIEAQVGAIATHINKTPTRISVRLEVPQQITK